MICNRCAPPQISCNHIPPPDPRQGGGTFFKISKIPNRGFKTLDYPPDLVGDTPDSPLTQYVVKTHICPPALPVTARV